VTAIPDIRVQAAKLARRILQELHYAKPPPHAHNQIAQDMLCPAM
jgi:hypothetical protein